MYIVVEGEDPGFDTFVNGRALARHEDSLEKLAMSLGVRPLIDFFSADENSMLLLIEEGAGNSDLVKRLPPTPVVLRLRRPGNRSQTGRSPARRASPARQRRPPGPRRTGRVRPRPRQNRGTRPPLAPRRKLALALRTCSHPVGICFCFGTLPLRNYKSPPPSFR